jgi:pimeloyl-ACP methyl ester carboxylesterase
MRGGREPADSLLLIAGLGQGTWVWQDVLPGLEQDRAVIMFEARGTGTRVDLPPRRAIRDMVEDVLLELDRPAHVLGFSMGGYVALTLARTRPDLVRSLLLVATGGGGRGRIGRPRYVADAMAEALGLPDPEFADRTMHFTFAPGWAEASPERFREIIQARIEHPTPYELLEAHAAACFGFYEEAPEVADVGAPALVVHGDQDLIVPVENGRMLARRLPQAEYVELPGRGHNLMLEDPETLVRVVRGFLP